MRFIVRFKICNRFGKGSKYDLCEICSALVDQYSIRNKELEQIVTLQIGCTFYNGDMEIRRIS